MIAFVQKRKARNGKFVYRVKIGKFHEWFTSHTQVKDLS